MMRWLTFLLLASCGLTEAEFQEAQSALTFDECKATAVNKYPSRRIIEGATRGTLRQRDGNYRILMEGEGGCSIQFTSRWAHAMSCAASQIECLEELRPGLAHRVRAAMRGERGRSWQRVI
ncbi:MAG: hypothetical protein ACKVPX_17905 [Myxococcaceae bacterium]